MTFDEELQQLILSSLTKSVMIDFRRTQAFQVGTKPRDGPFGASHWKAFDATSKDILLARPGKRIWCADTETARVKQTINYQPSFESTPPSRLFGAPDASPQIENVANINFCKLVPFCEVVLSLSERVIVLMDADTNKILQWHCDAGQIVDISLHEHTYSAYAIVCPSGETGVQRLAKISFNAAEFIASLMHEKQYARAVSLVRKYVVSDLLLLDRLMTELPDNVLRHIVSAHVQSIQVYQKNDVVVKTPASEVPEAPSPAVETPIQDLSVSILEASDPSVETDAESLPNTPAIVHSEPLAIPSSETSASSSLSRSPSMLSSRDELESSATISISSSPASLDASQSLGDSQTDSPSLAGSFLKAEEAPLTSSSSIAIAAPVAKRATGGAKKKKPRLAQIAPPSVGDRAPSPIMLEMQQRSVVPASVTTAPQSNPVTMQAAPTSKPEPTIDEGLNTSRLPMVIQSALSNPITTSKSETSNNPSPSSSPSLTPTLLHTQSAPLSTSPTPTVSATADKAIATADKAIGEIKSMAKKIIDLPSMFSRTSSAPVGTGANAAASQPTSPAMSHIDTSDELTSIVAEKLRKFRSSVPDVPSETSTRSSVAWEKRLLFDETLRPTLQEWFDTYSSALSSASRSGKFPLGSDVVIRELVTACFEFQVEASALPASKLRFWTDKEAQGFVTCYARYLSLSDSLAIANERGWLSCVDFLLEYDESVYNAREGHMLNPRFRSWEQIEELMQEPKAADPVSQQSLVKLLSKVSGDLALTMRFLPRLLVLIAPQGVQLALSSFPSLRPRNIENYTSDVPTLLQYYSKLMKKQASCRSMPDLVFRWFQLLLKDSSPAKEVLFDGEKPMKASQDVSWKHAVQLEQILSESDDDEYVLPDYDDLASLFAEHGYWNGLFFVLCRAELYSRAAQLAVDLDSAPFFAFLLQSPSVPPAMFPEILHVLLRNKRDNGSAITLGMFFSGCIAAIGARQTMILLESLGTAERSAALAALKPSFFQTLLRSAQKERNQQSAAHEILEAVDSYLWSMRSPMMASQFRALEQAEAQEARLHDNNLAALPYVTASQGFDGRMTHSINVSHRIPIVRAPGALASHWGVRTSLRGQVCPRCELQLHDSVVFGSGSSSTKIVVYEPCGHAFHESCVEEDCCVICVKKLTLQAAEQEQD
jgi:hypothetical protein